MAKGISTCADITFRSTQQIQYNTKKTQVFRNTTAITTTVPRTLNLSLAYHSNLQTKINPTIPLAADSSIPRSN